MKKQDVLEILEIEVRFANKFIKQGEEKVNKGYKESATHFLDMAITAERSAAVYHEKLWEVSQGELNEKEFEAFTQAEMLLPKITKLRRNIKNM